MMKSGDLILMKHFQKDSRCSSVGHLPICHTVSYNGNVIMSRSPWAQTLTRTIQCILLFLSTSENEGSSHSKIGSSTTAHPLSMSSESYISVRKWRVVVCPWLLKFEFAV